MHKADILLQPIITEKSTAMGELGKYAFKVPLKASKGQIAKSVEWAFEVHVVSVNTLRVKGKMKRYGRNLSKRPDWKKAIVTLRGGETIQLFEGA